MVYSCTKVRCDRPTNNKDTREGEGLGSPPAPKLKHIKRTESDISVKEPVQKHLEIGVWKNCL